MIHLLQSLRTGETELAEVPVPRVSSRSILVETTASVISAGTERMLVEFGRSGWLEKARSQPDKVRQVLDKVRTDGVIATLDAVRSKLDTPIPLGYCQAGIVREVGQHVTEFAPGDRVATNGPHAEFVRVAPTLAARIPEGVSFEAAAFAPLAAIGLQGLRLAAPTLGETIVVYGLGLIGLLTVQLARASGCRVIGIDRTRERCDLAASFGASAVCAEGTVDVVEAVMQFTGGVGADVVLLTLATDSHDPAHLAAAMSRKRGRIVLVGVAGLNLRREDFYRKELSFQVSCSYGPGRYDPDHEEKGIDYPLPFVRWTEGRNFAAVLGLMAEGRLDPLPLVTHRIPVAEAGAAYDLISGGDDSLGVVLQYPARDGAAPLRRSVALDAAAGWRTGAGRVAVIGAGNFATRLLIPAFRDAGAELVALASSGGASAAAAGRRLGFARATTEAEELLADPKIDTVVVATRHDSHASWAVRALRAGKHVFVEKPLALSLEELLEVEAAGRAASTLLSVGFNRRFAPHVLAAREALRARSGPLMLTITVNAGRLPSDHWTQDPDAGGGRIVGEACHFVDLARFLAASPISTLQVISARDPAGRVVADVTGIQLGFADGSLAAIQYFSNSSRAYPKERVELFFDGQAIRLDNFRRVKSWGARVGSRLPSRQDKGHNALVAAFLAAVRGGEALPIPFGELIEVSEASVHAARLAREGGGAMALPEREAVDL
jgi:predicted dehydrogenase/threonine dehydrogenase-like Zn-dependent dehydrogenase